MNTRCFRLFALTTFFISLVLAQPGMVLAETTEFIPIDQQPAMLVLGQPNFTSNAPATTPSGMRAPFSVAVDPTTGKVFVADQENQRVLRFGSVTALSNGAAAEAVLGQADFTSGEHNRGGTVAANSMVYPTGLSVDSEGRLWVTDMGNSRVLRFDDAATKANGVDADGVLGQPNFTSIVFTTTQNGMEWPVNVFADDGGRLWVADSDHNRVLRFDNAASKANGANADGVLGQPDFTSQTRSTTQNGMWESTGVFLDSEERLWVADVDNHRILRFDNAASKTNGANADGVLGQANFTSRAAACTQDGMNIPYGVFGDLDGRLYVADTFNNRVLIFEHAAELANGAEANHVLGQIDFTNCAANAGGISAISLNNPISVFYDPAAKVLWADDLSNHRILMYDTVQFQMYLPVVKK